MCKRSSRIWSFLLVIIMIINMLPVQTLALETEKNLTNDITAENPANTDDLFIVEELIDRRTEYTKEFQLNNGFRVASVYGYPVHYEENGEWKEIDNTLKLSNTRSGNAYTNTAGVWDVNFPQDMATDKYVSITKDGHTLSFRMTGEMHEYGSKPQLDKSEIIEMPTITDVPTSSVGAEVPSKNESVVAEECLTTKATGTITLTAPKKAVTATVEVLDIQSAKASEEYPEIVLEKLDSRLRYASIFEKTDLVFDLNSSILKESVVLNEHRDSLLGYTFDLNTADMVPLLQDDGSIELRDPETNTVVMFMPAPYLIDGAEETCYDVEVSLTGTDGSYILTYTLPQEWLAETSRQWPVILDPTVLPTMTIDNINDVTIGSGGTSDHAAEYLYCGYYGDVAKYKRSRIFLKYVELPELTSSDIIIKANIRLNLMSTNYSDGKSKPVIEVHAVNGKWSEKTITWNKKPSTNSKVEDYNVVYPGTGHKHWDVTDIVRGWYETGVNTGMMFRMSPSIEAEKNLYAKFCSSDHSSYYYYTRPRLTITYRNNNGLEDYWNYTSSQAGRAGTGYVNQYTGKLVWVRNDIGFGGNRMPVSISHIYNSNNHKDNSYGMGYGWRTNFNQRVYLWAPEGTGVGYCVWEDGDGTTHYFVKVDTGIYVDEDGLEMVATNTGSGKQKYAITDKYGNCSYFDTKGRLTELTNNQATESSILITYTSTSSSLISTVTDGAGRKYKFTYDDNNLLSKISYTGTGNETLTYVTFGYDANKNLITVTDKDELSSSYSYSGKHLLQSARDVDGYQLSYDYTTTSDGLPNRVKRIQESHNSIVGMTLGIEYGHNQTKLTENPPTEEPATEPTGESAAEPTEGSPPDPTDETAEESPPDPTEELTDESDDESAEEPTGGSTEGTAEVKNVQVIQFNNMGNVISIQDGEGRAQFAQYAKNDPADDTSSSNSKSNQLKLSSKLQNTVANILRNSSFENTSTWTEGSSSITQIVSSDTAYLGAQSLKVVNSSTETAASVYSEDFAVPSGATYTFSAYVKDSTGAAYLTLNEGNNVLSQSESLDIQNEWKRLEVSYTNVSNEAQTVTARLVASGNSTVYMDCVQVEKAPTASRYNLVENGDFSYADLAWSSSKGRVTADQKAPADQLDETVYILNADPTARKRIYQTVKVSGEKGDTFVLAGWAKADSVPIKDSREFGLIATFKDGDTVVNTSKVRFNASADSTIAWQYAASPVVAKGAFDSIQVEFAYNYNANTAYFDGIQLFKEEFGTSYTYDENGNVISVKDLQSQTTSYTYKSNDLTKEVLPNGAKMTYTYDKYHNVKTATSETGIIYSFTYDKFGNNKSVSITSDGVTLTSTATYTADGNYLVSTTDAVGNITTYDYDKDTGVLKSVKYPNDTEDSKTIYSYDSMYRLATAAATINTDTTLTANYTYNNDLLSKITTGSTTYNFTYGPFAQRSSIAVGSNGDNHTELATYEYTEPEHNLSKLTYGNGDYVNYCYDLYGRLITQTYEDEAAVNYNYDNSGALATVTDSATGIKTTYYYDLTDRLMKYAETADEFSHIVGYEYDLINNLTALFETINGTKYVTGYTYDKDNRVTSVAGGLRAANADGSLGINNATIKDYTYDGFGRVTEQVTSKYDGTYVAPQPEEDATEPTEPAVDSQKATVKTDSFQFTGTTEGDSTTTSSQVSKHTITTGGGENSPVYKEFTYTYDANGNILTISDGSNTTSYTYDKANQLIREDNQAATYTHIWTYDDAGNILKREEYAYTTGVPSGDATTINYSYSNANWGDLLTSYNSQTITHDTIGNPLSDGRRTYTWKHGRELAALTQDGVTWNFTYNADGIRTKRTNGSTTYNYVYNGSSLSQMSVGTHLLNFAYDASGAPMAVTYDGVTYYYATNLQGDIIAILDGSGNAVVEYSYDAWGKLLSTSGSMAASLGVHNPLRYRGYIYDSESSLYYLQSRYYDPALGRFISADAFVSTGKNPLDSNMFAYCGNNPVMGYDPTGAVDWGTFAEGAGLMSVGVTAIIVAAAVASGGACVPLLIAAGATFAAGGMTLANGVAEVVESTTGYNYMRDGMYGGNAGFYEGQKAVFETAAGVGTMAISAASTSPRVCFAAGTMILTANGAQAIETVQAGDYVWAWDEETGDVALKKVVETYINETDEFIHVFVNGEEIITTPTHPFYSPIKGWTEAVQLCAGDILILVNGEYVVVEKVQHEILESPVIVYNFQVAGYHTYFVTDSGVLVHNFCGPTSQNQMQRQVERGQVPNGVDRVDPPHTPGVGNSQPHVHFTDGTAINQDGSVHDAHKGIPTMTAKIVKWLTNNGWGVLRE